MKTSFIQPLLCAGMETIVFNIYQSAAVAAVFLVLGLFLVSRSELLRRFCIPAAVVGGLVFAITSLFLHSADVVEFHFDETLKNVFMMAFFCSVGFMASAKMRKAGGRMVVILLLRLTVLVVVQDVVGSSFAVFFGLDPMLGLCLGSVSLIGGHGTAAAYGSMFVEDFGIVGADTVAVAAATFGLAFSSLIGGPLAGRLVKRHNLVPEESEMELVAEEEAEVAITDRGFLHALILMVVCVGFGTYIVSAISEIGVNLPVYLGSMIIAMVIRNVCDVKGVGLPLREISVMGTISLSMFLVMALMTMKLWQITDMAMPMVVTLMVQLVIVALFSYIIIFRATGRNYDSAVYTTAVCGFGLGATPNAMANMQAMFKRFGESPVAFFIVPIVGSVFIDLINSGILTVFMNLL